MTGSMRVILSDMAKANDSSKSKPYAFNDKTIAASNVPSPPGRIGIAMPIVDAMNTVNTACMLRPSAIERLKKT